MNEAFVNEAQLADWLTDLRLPRIRDRLPGLLDEAARQELSLRDLVVFLCRTELAGRRRSRALLRLKQARFPIVRELDDFDFEAPAERQSGSAPGPRHRPLGGTR